MSSAIDVNVLLYASEESSAFRAQALDLIDHLAAGPDLFYLFWPVAMGYLRIATHPAIFSDPLSPEAATNNLEQLLNLPHCRVVGEGERFWPAYRSTTERLVVRGNLVPDAHLVAMMREHGVDTLWSHDRDFRKFEGIRIRDPFA